jgi:SNF2 family DNA or RNA helicase
MIKSDSHHQLFVHQLLSEYPLYIWTDATSPAEDTYSIQPNDDKLKRHQIKGVQFFWQTIVAWQAAINRGAFLGDDMGLGKTV